MQESEQSGHAHSARAGFSLIELVVVLALLTLLAGVAYFFTHETMLRKRCKANLRHIYAALELYEIDRGTLPRLAMFPDDPKQDADSIVVALRSYGPGGDMYICPASPSYHKTPGLTYLWNIQLNGRKLSAPNGPTWMLTDMNALSDSVPAPHLGRYNILYTDGHIEKSKNPPPGLRDL